jgi:hypothetical protein
LARPSTPSGAFFVRSAASPDRQVDYTTGVGVRGGGLLTGRKGKLLKGWTISSQLNAGSGLPLSPIYLTSVPARASSDRSARI